jgi:hypothetical protein
VRRETLEKLKTVALVIYYVAWFAVCLFIGYLAYEAMNRGL